MHKEIMIKLSVTVKIQENYGQVLKAEVWPSDKVGEVIERLCRSACIKHDDSVFMTLENGGTKLTNSFPIGNCMIQK